LKKNAHINFSQDNNNDAGEYLLTSTTKKRPIYELLSSHEQHQTHCLRIKQSHLHHVPVLIGSIPRHDQEVVYPKYCQLMLILFKPWQTVNDLRDSEQSWPDAFTSFRQSEHCTADIAKILDNMQLLHESKDSHDDHFSQRHVHHHSFEVAPEIVGDACHAINNFLGDEIDESSMLEHLEAIKSCHSEQQTHVNMNMLDCVMHAEDTGIFTVNPQTVSNLATTHHGHSELVTSSSEVESKWKSAYDAC